MCTENPKRERTDGGVHQDRARYDSADALNWTPKRRIFVQRAVRSDLVVVAAIASKGSAQMRLPYDNDVVETFAAD